MRNAIVLQGGLDRGVELITNPFSYGDLGARIRDILDRNPKSGVRQRAVTDAALR